MSELQGFDYVGEQLEKAAAEKKFISVQAEENLLHQLFKKPALFEDTMDILTASDFGDKDLGCIFYAMAQLNEKQQSVDYTSVGVYVEQNFPKRADRILSRMISISGFREYGTGVHEAFKTHVKIIKDLSIRRKAIEQFDKLTNDLRDTKKDIGETLAELQDVAEVTESDEAVWMSLDDVNTNTYLYLEKRQNGDIKAVPSGIDDVDKIIGGFFAGELTIIAARPAVGKSAFGLNIALMAAKAGFKVGFVSCEMSDIGFGQRTLSRGSQVDGSRLRQAKIEPEDWDMLAYALTDMNGMKVEFMFAKDNPGRMTVESVSKAVRRKAKRGEIDILIVDYIGILQSVKTFKEDRYRIAYISGELKRLSQVANIPVVALCQVNRDAHGSMPTLAQLRDSGSIEQDADGVIFIHRPDTHEDKSINKDDVAVFYDYLKRGDAYISIGIAKQRNGKTGVVNVLFNPEKMEYIQLMRMEDVKNDG